MPDSQDYRLYLESQFKASRDLMTANFETVHQRLDAIEVQTTKTNGTVQHHEKLLTENLPHSILNCPQAEKIEHIEMVLVGEDAVEKRKKAEKEENHAKTIRAIMVAGICVTILISIFSFFANRSKVTLLQNQVDQINIPVQTRGGVIKWYPSGVVIDSLKKK
jgi:hypothetical protein